MVQRQQQQQQKHLQFMHETQQNENFLPKSENWRDDNAMQSIF